MGERRGPYMGLRSVAPFLAISFGLTWGIALLMILIPEQLTQIFGENGPASPLYVLAVYAPGFAGLLLVFCHYGWAGLGSFL